MVRIEKCHFMNLKKMNDTLLGQTNDFVQEQSPAPLPLAERCGLRRLSLDKLSTSFVQESAIIKESHHLVFVVSLVRFFLLYNIICYWSVFLRSNSLLCYRTLCCRCRVCRIIVITWIFIIIRILWNKRCLRNYW